MFTSAMSGNQLEEDSVSVEMVVTYDADFSMNDIALPQKHLRTVEYVLGAGAGTNAGQTGTDILTTPQRASDANMYAGTSWNATKATAGTKNIVLSGSGIQVVSAYLDVTAGLITAVDVSDLELALDVSPSQGAGWDTPVSPMRRNGVTYLVTDNSGLSSPVLTAKADVTSLLQIQSDSDWNSGVAMVGMMSVVGPTWVNATMKLIITYEENYSLTPHTETKTVRFPLRSTVTTDSGTRAASCAAATTCSFRYSVELPDLANTADIQDVWFELSYVEDGVATATVSINGGAAGVAHSFMESLADNNERFLIYRPAVGGADFGTTTQQLDIAVTGTAIGGLGGEVVVTYDYNTGAATQVETVRYFMGQQKTLPTTATTTFTQYPTISNASPSIRNIWFKVHDPVTNTPALRIGGKIGTSATTTALYAPTMANPRGGTLHIIHDVGAATTSWTGASTPISVEAQHAAATYDAPPSAEAFITFYWSGASGGTVTKSAKFFAGQSGPSQALAQSTSTFPFTVVLPETVTKTYRSSYLSFSVLHTDATSIIAGTMRFGLNGSTTYNVAEATEDTESYRGIFLAPATTTDFLPNQVIPWGTRMFTSAMSGNQLEEYSVSVEMVVTYDADLELLVPHFEQNFFRVYEDNDALIPAPAWPGGNGLPVGENDDVTLNDFPPMNGENVRLRMSVLVATTSMAATTTQFKLQFGQRGLQTACSAIGTWTDLGNPASGALWRGVAGTPLDNQELSINPPTGGDLVLSLSDRAGSYEEQNDTRINPFNVAVGEELEFDWNIESNGVATDTPYCFRMTQSNGTVFDAYHFYPTLWTAGYTPETRNWQWFDDETNADPSTSLAGENIAPSDVVNANTIKLRITVDEVNGSNGVDQRFKVQYSQYSDFSQGVYDVLGTSTCATNSLWCYGDGVDTDGGGIVTRRLSDSTANGTHNESSTTPSNPLGGTATEYEFTLKHAGARANATYFFRLFDVTHGNPVLHAPTKSYPSLATQGATVSSSVSLIATSTVTEGVTTDIATTPTEIPYGRLPMGTTVTAAQRFSVSSNSTNGYQLYLGERQPMLNERGTEIWGHAGTNTTPISWASGCAPWLSSCFGYHAGDDSLSESSARFVVNDTYAHLESVAREVAYNSGPVVNEETDIIFKIEARSDQEPGNYTSQLYYVVVPIF